METKILLNENEIVQINGVAITPEFLDFIKSWRESDNSIIIEIQNYIADATSSILLAMDYVCEEYNRDMLKQIQELNRTRINLKYLMAPKKQA